MKYKSKHYRTHAHEVSQAEKVQKVLARLGLGSRREIETWIQAGRIEINEKPAQIGDRASLNDRIKLDGKLIRMQRSKPETRVLLYHKPAGEVCSRRDPEGRPTVFDRHRVLKHKSWIMVGRLDFNTSGLLLFTNDGELANRLMHPSSQVEREYAVRIFGEADAEVLLQLQSGVMLEDGPAKFNAIVDAGGAGKNHWYHVVLTEGRNREVRRLWESLGFTVTRLIRVRFGHLQLPRGLRQGQIRTLPEADIKELWQFAKNYKKE